MTNGLDLTVNALLRMQEFELRTGLPAVASLEELELSGGRYLSSRTKRDDGKPATEYVLVDYTGAGQNILIYKRLEGDERFRIHLETNAKERY